MANTKSGQPFNLELQKENERLKALLEEKEASLQEAQETLEAIRTGAVDGLVRSTPEGEQVFILKGADKPYRDLIEQMNEGALLVSDNGTILYCNSGFAQLVDTPLDRVMGTNINDWVSIGSEVFSDLLAGEKTGWRRVFDVTFQTTKKQLVPTQVSINQVPIDTTNAKGLIVTDLTKHMEEDVKHYTANLEKEITERKKAEDALKESEALFSAAFNASNVASIVSRWRDGRYIDINDTFLRKFEYTREEVIDRTSLELKMYAHPEQRAKFLSLIDKGAVQNLEMTFRTKTGKLIDTLVSTQKIALAGETYIVTTMVDITERKQMQQKIEEYSRDLERLVEMRTRQLRESERLAAIGQVAGMVGHDIRNPLQAIVSELYFAKESMKEIPKEREPKEVIESIDFIQEQVDYISKIVADLQDFAKPLKPEFTEVELCDLISGAVKAITIPNNIETALVCEKQIPLIKLDKTFMTRVLTNLATNAIQAMPNGGKFTIQASRQDESAVITVQDTGLGIPESEKPKIFTPLFTTKAKGQGFGLPVVRRLVEAQGGRISFESEVGKGTKFTVILPINNIK